jgi:hypothetical protein
MLNEVKHLIVCSSWHRCNSLLHAEILPYGQNDTALLSPSLLLLHSAPLKGQHCLDHSGLTS